MTRTLQAAIPPNLVYLVQAYVGCSQESTRYRPSSWIKALEGIEGSPTRLLVSPETSTETKWQRFRAKGDRDVTRTQVATVCSAMDLDDLDSVIEAFVLVMAWGSGTKNGRSLRYTPRALVDRYRAAETLSGSARELRQACEYEQVIDPYRRFNLPGVREAFFTKWFAFAGYQTGRAWQPLILDSRVRATLNQTLGVWLNQFTSERNDPNRYVAYLKAMHAWADELETPTSAERLEWILFDWNGKPISAVKDQS